VGAAFARQRDQRRHRWSDLGVREVGGDEAWLKSRQADAVRNPERSVVPPVAGSARAVAAAARRDDDKLAAAEQALLGLEVDGKAVGDNVVDPCLDRARSAEVVKRQAEEDRVGLLDFGDEPLRESPRPALGCSGLVAR